MCHKVAYNKVKKTHINCCWPIQLDSFLFGVVDCCGGVHCVHIPSALLIYLCDISLAWMIIYDTWRSPQTPLTCTSAGLDTPQLPQGMSMCVCVCVCVCVRECVCVYFNRQVTSRGCSAAPDLVTVAP